MSEFRIRLVRENELDGLLDLYEHLHVDDVPLERDRRLQELWAEILSDPHLHYLAGELDGELVSSCTL